MIGKTISHYHIIEKIGEGGMGEVYLADDTKLKRQVAIKILPSRIAANETDEARFLQEAQAAAAISHPNVCVIHDIIDHDDQQFIVMEYVEGQTLSEKIVSMQLQIDQVIEYAIQIGIALHAAHEKNIVHRDIKSDNIMVTKTDQIKVMDFGLAKLKGSLKITKSSSTVGTLSYMSPEHLQGSDVDVRSDIFSFGVLLYEMLTGKLPFKGEYESALMYSILNEEPEPAEKYRSDLSSEWLHVLGRSLEKDPDSRYQSMTDMLIDLKRLRRDSSRISRESLENIPVAKKTKRMSGLFSEKRLIAAVTGLMVVAITLLIIFKPWAVEQPLSEPKARSLAVMYFENNTGDATLDHWEKALSDLLIADLVQSKYIHVLSGDKLFHILRQMNILNEVSYSSEDLKEVGSQAEVRYILRGNFSKAGDVFRINTILQTADASEPIGSETVEGTGEQSIFRMVDDLTRRIRSSFQFTNTELQSDLDLPVDMITTRSPEAYKYYSEGRKYHDAGEFEKSIEFMENAVALDPEFAMAYRSLSVAYENMGYRVESKKYGEKALEFSDRVSDRERYRIQAYYFSLSEATYREAITAYNQLLDVYPDDEFGINLGVIYIETEQLDKAKAFFQHCIDIGDKKFYAYFQMSIILNAEGRYDQAQKILETYVSQIEDHGLIRLVMAINHVITGRWDAALSAIDKGYALMPAYFFVNLRGNIYLRLERNHQADSTFRSNLQSDDLMTKVSGWLHLASLALTEGRFQDSMHDFGEGIKMIEAAGEDDTHFSLYLLRIYVLLRLGETEQAIKECDLDMARSEKSGAITRRINVLLLKGIAHLKENDLKSAKDTHLQMKQLIDGFINSKKIRDYYILGGMIDVQENNYKDGIDNFLKAVQLLPFQSFIYDEHGLFYYHLALAYYHSGDFDKARNMFEKITTLTSGIWYYGDLYAKSFYMLGRIYDEQDAIEDARSYYNKFLEIWKNADKNQPEFVDAKKRLARLVSTN
jgi:serine/threonine protein kinase/Tfp pilus assembly protein PilF